MVLSSKASNQKIDDFLQSAILSTLRNLLKPDDALFLTRALVAKKTQEELIDFLGSPIVAINAEKSVVVDNKFIKRHLLENNQIEVLEQLNKAKIIINNCSNVSIKGLDVICLMGNTVRLISPEEDQIKKNEIFMAKDNKVITTINTAINFSYNNSFKSLLHSTIDNMKKTNIINLSKTSQVPELHKYLEKNDTF